MTTLGFSSAPLDALNADCPYTNKLGGQPVWLRPPPPELVDGLLACPTCGSKMTLMAQLYTPLHTHPRHHRVLYLLACLTPPCAATSAGWRVLRDQLDLDSVPYLVRAASVPKAALVASAEAAAAAAAEASEAEAKAQPSASVSAAALMFGSDSDSDDDSDDDFAALLAARDAAASSASSSAAATKQKHGSAPPAASSGKFAVIAVDAPPASSEATVGELVDFDPSEWPQLYRPERGAPLLDAALDPYGVTAAPEPSGRAAGDKDVDDVDGLAHLMAGVSLEDAGGASCDRASGPGDDDEVYESVGGALFRAYCERVARAPSQLLRYAAEPLLIEPLGSVVDTESDSDDEGEAPARASAAVPPCRRCGAARLFELQLLSSFINAYSDESLPHARAIQSMAWGTALVFSCSASCDGDLTAEHIVVQSAERIE